MIAVGVYVLNYAGVFQDIRILKPLVTHDDDAFFTCPSQYEGELVDSCQVTGKIECNSQSSGAEQRVIGRINDFTFDGPEDWIAYTPDAGGLDGYTFSEMIGDTTSSERGTLIPSLTDRYNINVWRNQGTNIMYASTLEPRQFYVRSSCTQGQPFCPEDSVEIAVDREYCAYHRWNWEITCEDVPTAVFTPGSISDPQALSTEVLFGCNGVEICSEGGSTWSCDGDFKVDGIHKGSASCTSEYGPCEKIVSLGIIQKGDEAQFYGGDFIVEQDKFVFDYLVHSAQDECVVSECYSSDGYYFCSSGQFDTFNPQDCTGGEVCYDSLNGADCRVPFNIVVDTIDDVYLEEESIEVDVLIQSEDMSSGNVVVEIREGTPNSIPAVTEISRTMSFTSGTSERFTFSGLPDGTYFVIITIDMPQDDIVHGIYEEERTMFTVSDEVVAIFLTPTQERGGVDHSNKAYTGIPVKVKYIITTGSEGTFPDSYDVSYSLGSINQPLTAVDMSEGLYTFEVTPTIPGTLTFYGTVTKDGYTTPPWTVSIPVETATVDLAWERLPDFVTQGTTDTFSFKTKNPEGELIDTLNNVEVKIKGRTGEQPTITQLSTGFYEFEYFFEERGDYQFTVTASDPEGVLANPSPLVSPLINSGDEPTPDCIINSDCSFIQRCGTDSGKCETNVQMLMVIFAGLVIVVLAIVMIVKFSKGRKSTDFGF